MPIHYGSKEHHFVTISSPLATQLPQGKFESFTNYILFKNVRIFELKPSDQPMRINENKIA